MHRLAPHLPPPPARPSAADLPDQLAILLVILIDTRQLRPRLTHAGAPSEN